MCSELSLGLVGIGGYGRIYLDALLDNPAQVQGLRFAAAADPFAAASPRLGDLRARGIPVFASLEALHARQSEPIDLLIIASPIHLHCAHTTEGLAHGSHILCEKPLCVSLSQASLMADARDRAERQVAIGYQWSFCPAIQKLKADIHAGDFGAPGGSSRWPSGRAMSGTTPATAGPDTGATNTGSRFSTAP